MYLVGAPHPHKRDAQRVLEQAVVQREKLVSDAEVLQEILHRYVKINRRDAIQPAFDALLGLVEDIFPLELSDIQKAKEITLGVHQLSARDAVHVAVMQRHDVAQILSFDSGFDVVPGITRLH